MSLLCELKKMNSSEKNFRNSYKIRFIGVEKSIKNIRKYKK